MHVHALLFRCPQMDVRDILIAFLLFGLVAFAVLWHRSRAQTSPTKSLVAANEKKNYVLTLSADPDTLEEQLPMFRKFRNMMYGAQCSLTPTQIEELSSSPSFVSVYEDIDVQACMDPVESPSNDKLLSHTASSQSMSWAISRIGLDPASMSNNDKYDVFILDTGVDMDHEDLNVAGGYNLVSPGYSPTDFNGHGTHIAGIVAAKNNDKGVLGVLPGARIWSIKVLNDDGSGSMSTILSGLDLVAWLIGNDPKNKAVNLSLGGFVGTRDYTPLDNAVERIAKKGVPVTVAAGNSSSNADLFTPSHALQALTVGAYDSNDTFARFSNYGSSIDLLAPGVDILSTFLGSERRLSGTSMAAPLVCGLTARFNNGKRSGTEIRNILLARAQRKLEHGENPRISQTHVTTASLSAYA